MDDKNDKDKNGYPLNSEAVAANISVKDDLYGKKTERENTDPEDLTTEENKTPQDYNNVMDTGRDDNLPATDDAPSNNIPDREKTNNT